MMLEDSKNVYLLIVDDSSEFRTALKVANAFAGNSGATIALLYVVEPLGFQQWGSVEEQMLVEQKRVAQARLDEVGKVLTDMGGSTPHFCIKEGPLEECVSEAIEERDDIRALVLGAGDNSNPLISHFTGKRLAALSAPLFIIPNNKD